jgi:NAD(P)-dependent dehydrogenase (short-subunit alcohol dehydrogenase family)
MSSTIILITGANTGLGLETVKSLLRSPSKSYTILLGGRDFEKAKTAAEVVREEYLSGGKSESQVIPVQIDLEDDASIEALKERVEGEFGRVDVLVNNGGEFVCLQGCVSFSLRGCVSSIPPCIGDRAGRSSQLEGRASLLNRICQLTTSEYSPLTFSC